MALHSQGQRCGPPVLLPGLGLLLLYLGGGTEHSSGQAVLRNICLVLPAKRRGA